MKCRRLKRCVSATYIKPKNPDPHSISSSTVSAGSWRLGGSGEGSEKVLILSVLPMKGVRAATPCRTVTSETSGDPDGGQLFSAERSSSAFDLRFRRTTGVVVHLQNHYETSVLSVRNQKTY